MPNTISTRLPRRAAALVTLGAALAALALAGCASQTPAPQPTVTAPAAPAYAFCRGVASPDINTPNGGAPTDDQSGQAVETGLGGRRARVHRRVETGQPVVPGAGRRVDAGGRYQVCNAFPAAW